MRTNVLETLTLERSQLREFARMVAYELADIVNTRKELTREEMAEQMGVSRTTFDRYRKMYSLDVNAAVKRNGRYFYNIDRVNECAQSKRIFRKN